MKTTKEHMKKLISMMVMFGLITSQVACAGKIQRVSAPLDQTKFPKDYTYTVKLKNQEKIRGLQADDLDNSQGKLNVKTPLETKSLMSQDIEYIYGLANVGTERNVPRNVLVGMGVGTLIGAALGFIPFAGRSFVKGACGFDDSSNCDRYQDDTFWDDYKYLIVPTGLGFLVGAFAGAMTKPKKKQILIFPTVTPSSGGVNGGANVQITFK